MRRSGHYLFTLRYAVVLLLISTAIDYLISEPTRIIVNSSLFITAVYAITLFSGMFIKRLFPVHSSLFLLWLVIPYVYLELVQFRFNGGVDSSYDNLYWISTGLLAGQGLLWLLSLYPLNLLFRTLLNKQRNTKIKQTAIDCITDQLALEKHQPDESYKACAMGLYQLQDLVKHFPLQGNSNVFLQKLIAAMQHYQNTFTTEFNDESFCQSIHGQCH